MVLKFVYYKGVVKIVIIRNSSLIKPDLFRVMNDTKIQINRKMVSGKPETIIKAALLKFLIFRTLHRRNRTIRNSSGDLAVFLAHDITGGINVGQIGLAVFVGHDVTPFVQSRND